MSLSARKAGLAAALALCVFGAGYLVGRSRSAEPSVVAPGAALQPSAASSESEASSSDVVASAAPSAVAASAAAPSAVSSAATEPSSSLASPSLADLKRLEQNVRSIDDALHLAQGHRLRAEEDARALIADLRANPSLREDASTLAYAYKLALDPDVSPIILAGLAEFPSPTIADFLDDLARRGDPGARLVLLARDLRDLPQLVAVHSPPLRLALELERVRSCGQALALLPRVQKTGDSRSMASMVRFGRITGCGPKGRDDCFPCLREKVQRSLLEEATLTCQSHWFKAPWIVR